MSISRRILLLGAQGQLGRELQRSFSDFGEVIAADRKRVDLADRAEVRRAIRAAEPEIILNAAAYTAVDKAESEPEAAMHINAVASRVMAEEASRIDAVLVHYSTDYVFDGTKVSPWKETDVPNPLNVYGKSKLAGEEAIQEVGGRYLIFRTSWVYGPEGNNFLRTMLRLGREKRQLRIVDDQVGAPTSAITLAAATKKIVQGIWRGEFGESERWAGLYHMACGGSVSWCGFAREIFAQVQSKCDFPVPELIPIATSEYPTPAQRPRNSVLSGSKLEAFLGAKLPDWREALEEVFERGVAIPS